MLYGPYCVLGMVLNLIFVAVGCHDVSGHELRLSVGLSVGRLLLGNSIVLTLTSLF